MSLHCFLVCIVSDEKSAVILLFGLMLFPPPSTPPQGAFKVFCLLLVFSHLTMLCFGEVFFMPLVLRVPWASWTCGFTAFYQMWKTFYHSFFIYIFFTSSLETPIRHIWVSLRFSHCLVMLFKYFQPFFLHVILDKFCTVFKLANLFFYSV